MENDDRKVKKYSRTVKTWLWISVLLAVGGALMLYPIGAAAANAVFVLVKICMVAGLFILIFAEKQGGYCLWASASIGAVVMTIIKWHLAGGGSFLMGGSIFVDIFMPVLLLILMKREKSM